MEILGELRLWVRDIGFPIAACCALGWALYLLAAWYAREVIVPSRERWFRYMDNSEQTIQKLLAALEAVSDTLAILQTEIRSLNCHEERQGKAQA